MLRGVHCYISRAPLSGSYKRVPELGLSTVVWHVKLSGTANDQPEDGGLVDIQSTADSRQPDSELKHGYRLGYKHLLHSRVLSFHSHIQSQ